MAVRNIGGDSHDRSYRYKRPVLTINVIGKGNGIKTILTNIDDVAISLKCPKEYLIKFIGVEMSTMVHISTDTINGEQRLEPIEDVIEKYIKTFVLCKGCSLPEINLYIDKKRICTVCRSCGSICKIKIDHKICKYILANPPEVPDDEFNVGGIGISKKTKTKLSKQEKREAKIRKQREMSSN